MKMGHTRCMASGSRLTGARTTYAGPYNRGNAGIDFAEESYGLQHVFFCARPPSSLCAFAERTEDHKQMVVTAFDPVKGRGPELTRLDIDPDLNLWTDNLLWNISPDGTRLAFARGPEGPIQIRSLLGGPTQVIQAKGLNRMRLIQWTSDGKGLFVSNLTKDGSEVVHVDLQGSAKLLWKCKSRQMFPAAFSRWSPVGDLRTETHANMWMMENF